MEERGFVLSGGARACLGGFCLPGGPPPPARGLGPNAEAPARSSRRPSRPRGCCGRFLRQPTTVPRPPRARAAPPAHLEHVKGVPHLVEHKHGHGLDRDAHLIGAVPHLRVRVRARVACVCVCVSRVHATAHLPAVTVWTQVLRHVRTRARRAGWRRCVIAPRRAERLFAVERPAPASWRTGGTGLTGLTGLNRPGPGRPPTCRSSRLHSASSKTCQSCN